MFDVCWGCGEWHAEKEILERSEGGIARCPDCGHVHPFRYLPLLVITGASGSGKSTILQAMVRDATSDDVTSPLVPLESDALWAAGARMDIVDYADLWQGVCVGIHQSGRPVLLFGAGLNPENMEPTPHRSYFPAIHYLALVADDDDLAARLTARPDWRGSSSAEAIHEHVSYNRALKAGEFAPEHVPFETLDTSNRSVDEAVESTREWVTRVLAGY